MNDSLAALSLFALALGVTGCKTWAQKETVVLTPLGEVGISGLPRGFDANDPRLVRASNEINRAVGHRVDLHFVTDHMPQYAGYFEALFDPEMMKLAHDLNAYKKSRPERFRKVSRSLKKIEFDYDGSLSDARAVFERRKKQVVFTLVGEGIDHNALSSALNSVYLEEQAQGYARASARAVPAREHADYFDDLRSYAPDQARVFENIASAMADVREPKDLAKMQSYFKDRARKSPANERKMRHMLEAFDRRTAEARTPERDA